MIRITVFSLTRAIAGFVGIVAFTTAAAFAQSEVDPDHFDSPNTEPIALPKVAPAVPPSVTRYDGKFTLPYMIHCNGKALPPGEYSLSLRLDGKTGQGTVTSKDQTVGIVGVVLRLERAARRDALLVENKRNKRTLSVIRLSQLDFILGPQPHADDPSNPKHTLVESLPVIAARKDRE